MDLIGIVKLFRVQRSIETSFLSSYQRSANLVGALGIIEALTVFENVRATKIARTVETLS